MPRAKFIQTMLYNLIATCVGTSVALFAIWTSIKARENTSPNVMVGTGAGAPTAGAATTGYNSSQSAVCAIWLFFQVYLINVLRAKFPQFNFPVIIYSIVVSVAMTYGPLFPTMNAGISFATSLIEAFLAGFAIATGVSLLILPMTSRQVVFKEMTGYIGALRGTIKAQTAYMRALEEADVSQPFNPSIEKHDTKKKTKHQKRTEERSLNDSPEARALKAAVLGLSELHGKLHGDLTFAKREFAYGNLSARDMSEMSKLLRGIMLPVVGLSSIIDISERLGDRLGSYEQEDDPSENAPVTRKDQVLDEFHAIMKTLQKPFAEITQAIDDGLEHVLLTLQLKKPPKRAKQVGNGIGRTRSRDVEAVGDDSRPGQGGFAAYLDRKNNDFYAGREITLRSWCAQKGIELPADYFQYHEAFSYDTLKAETEDQHQRNQKQLYLVLYVSHHLVCLLINPTHFIIQSSTGRPLTHHALPLSTTTNLRSQPTIIPLHPKMPADLWFRWNSCCGQLAKQY